MKNNFIFTPGIWFGEGKISFSASPDFLKFYTKWEIQKKEGEMFKATQIVEMLGIEEKVVNTFHFQIVDDKAFTVLLESSAIKSSKGTGLRDITSIQWKFHDQETCQGFESYVKQQNGEYIFHAEYGIPDEFRTLIEGRIWLKTTP